MAWHTLVIPDAAPKISDTLAGLGDGEYDGHVGIIRLGTYPDVHTEEFIWDGDEERWIGTVEHMVMTSDDAWAIEMSRHPSSRFDNAWVRFNGGVGWEVGRPRAKVRTTVVLPPAGGNINITMDPLHDPTDFVAPGQVLCRDVLVTYTGITDSGSGLGILTGCTHSGGHDGKTLNALYDAVIPYGANDAGDPGGWGCSVFPLDRVGEMWAAGFRLQERLNCWITGSVDLHAMSIAPWYINRDFDEAYDKPSLDLSPRTGMLGPGITLTGPAYDIGGYIAPGNHNKTEERGMEMRRGGWSDWVSATPTKRVLVPVLYGKMSAGAKDNGECYAVSLALRWVSPA